MTTANLIKLPRVEKALGRVAGVASAEVNLATDTATVSLSRASAGCPILDDLSSGASRQAAYDPSSVEYNPPMRLRLLRLLAVAVALALPLQGFAAVAAQCLTLGQHQDDGHGHGHDHGDLGGHDHGSHSQSDQSGSSDGHDGGKGVHCGLSTACIAGTAGLPFLSAPSHAPHLFSQFSPLGVQPDGLYRPPLAL